MSCFCFLCTQVPTGSRACSELSSVETSSPKEGTAEPCMTTWLESSHGKCRCAVGGSKEESPPKTPLVINLNLHLGIMGADRRRAKCEAHENENLYTFGCDITWLDNVLTHVHVTMDPMELLEGDCISQADHAGIFQTMGVVGQNVSAAIETRAVTQAKVV